MKKMDNPTAHMDGLDMDLANAAERIAALEARLRDIGDYAHDHSTGPAVPDALWTVREMAYELV